MSRDYHYSNFVEPLFKVNNENTKTMCEICSKLKAKTPERCQCRCSGVFIVNFEQISHFFSFSMLTLTSKCQLQYVSKLQISINHLTHLRTMFHLPGNQSIDLQIKWITLFLQWPEHRSYMVAINSAKNQHNFIYSCIKSLLDNFPILYPLKTPENLWFCSVFRGENENIGQKWVKDE